MARSTKKDYRHSGEKAVQRPDIGLEPHVMKRDNAKKRNRKYPKKPSLASEPNRDVDSSKPPEFTWNENPDRDFAEFLIGLAFDAARGKDVFPAVWRWSKTRTETIETLADARVRLDSMSGAFLKWTGKSDQRDVEIPTPPLFVHEYHAASAILEVMQARTANDEESIPDLFGDSDLDVEQRIDAYDHKGDWVNRLIHGDSLQVMNSLLVREKESLGRKVQMIYFDPPYGVKFGSNFQPFVKNPDVTDGEDKSMSREPEMVTAFRDTWSLGMHSYMTYIRDRLMMARELLADSGSMFVQISEANVHRVRQVMDEVFGAENFVSQIWYQTTTTSSSAMISKIGDYILWYAKDKKAAHYNQLYLLNSDEAAMEKYPYVLLDNGECRRLTREEKESKTIPSGARLFDSKAIQSQGAPSVPQPFEFEGDTYHAAPGNHWRCEYPEGMNALADAGRLVALGKGIRFARFQDDFPYQEIHNNWTGTSRGGGKLYACQTANKVIERCMLMSSEPGDIVLDITCGSGVTPVVAEEWGRRWIAVDISRVPLAIARQRLMTEVFPHYELEDEEKGPGGGFAYRAVEDGGRGGLVKKVTAKSISRNEEPPTVRIVDKPEIVKGAQRVCGPFTMESTIQPAASLDTIRNGQADEILKKLAPEDEHIDLMTDVLLNAGNVAEAGQPKLKVRDVERIDGCDYLHSRCVCIEKDKTETKTAIAFGPKDSAIPANLVQEAATEAMNKGFQKFFMIGFAFDAAARTISEKLGIQTRCVEVAYDMAMDDLLKTSKSSEIFTITGAPDITLEKVGKDEFRVIMNGLDTYGFEDGKPKSIKGEDLPCWILDTDYNGLTFYGRSFFTPGFDLDDKKNPWKHFRRAFGRDIPEEEWESMLATESPPFKLGDHKRVAVMAIDPRGNSLMAIRDEGDAVESKKRGAKK